MTTMGSTLATARQRRLALTDGTPPDRAPDMASENAVSGLWRASWAQLRACHPDLEDRLAELAHKRPTRYRALARLEASAGRAAGRCLRNEVSPAALLMKLQAWQAALLVELERES
jgi:hypothetical protein